MRNRRTRLWLPLLALALAVLPGLYGESMAAEYAVVANYSAGTVSLIQNTGGGWMASGTSVNVGGSPQGVATSGQYAIVANNGYVDVIQASVNSSSGMTSLAAVQRVSFDSRVEWATAGPNGNIYVSTKKNDGGAIYELNQSSGVWSSHLVSSWPYFLPRGLAVIPASGGAEEKLAVSKMPAPGGGDNEVEVFQNGESTLHRSFEGTRVAHVAPWITETQQFALVARQATLTQPPQEFPDGYLTAVNMASGAYHDLVLPYAPYAVAVVGEHAYVTDYNSSKIYKYLLSATGDVPAMSLEGSLALGNAGIRQMTASGDGRLLVTSFVGNTVHSISLANFGQSYTVGTFSGAVGIGVIHPLTVVDPVVPEPSALATLATGLLAAAGRQLRRKGRRKEG